MAVTPSDTNKAFLREVDEELRREQLASVWSRYGLLIVLGIVAALAALGGALWWHHHREAARGTEGEQLQAAFDSLGANDIAGANKALPPLAASDSPGYRALSQMSQADVRLQQNDPKGAARLFASVAGDTGVGQPLRDLALLRQTSTEFDVLRPEVVVGRLKPLAVKGKPYFGSAGELVAISYLRMNRRALAAQLYGQLAADDGVPATLRQRAVQMASVAATVAPNMPATPSIKEMPRS